MKHFWYYTVQISSFNEPIPEKNIVKHCYVKHGVEDITHFK